MSIVGPRPCRSQITLDNPRERYARPVGASPVPERTHLPYCGDEADQVPASPACLAYAPQRRGPEVPALHALRRISGEIHPDRLQGGLGLVACPQLCGEPGAEFSGCRVPLEVLDAGDATTLSLVSEADRVTSIRQAAAVCNVTPPVVRRWLSLELITEPPWTLQQLHQVRDETDPRVADVALA